MLVVELCDKSVYDFDFDRCLNISWVLFTIMQLVLGVIFIITGSYLTFLSVFFCVVILQKTTENCVNRKRVCSQKEICFDIRDTVYFLLWQVIFTALSHLF